MKTKVSVSSIFHYSLECAFKTFMLCDVSKVHTSHGIMPKVTHYTEDDNWGKPGSTNKVFVAKSLTQKGGFASIDKVGVGVKNKFWIIDDSNLQSGILGFYKFTGEWKTTELESYKVLIDYTYTLDSKTALLYPLNWLYSKLFWKIYMKRVLENIRLLIRNNEHYFYD